MTKFLFKNPIAMLVVIATPHVLAQTPAPTTSATASDVAALRQQVEALTETVQALQQQVKDQRRSCTVVYSDRMDYAVREPKFPGHCQRRGTPN